MQTIQKNVNNRVFYLDVLRVIACLSVIMIHSSTKYVETEICTFNFWIGNLFDSFARVGVPIFVMISGALLLDKNYEFTTKKLINHITKLIIFFVCWSALYCIASKIIIPLFVTHEPLNLIEIIGSLIKGHYHLWFVYLIVGLYLIVPLLRLWVKDENKKYVEYFIILSVVFTFILPQIISIGSNYHTLFAYLDYAIEHNLQLNYVAGYTTYFILGWYIHNYEMKHDKLIYLLGSFGFIITVVGTYLLSATTGKAIQLYDNLSFHILCQSVAVFTFIKAKYIHTVNKENRLIRAVSDRSLGIYAIHAMIVSIMYNVLEKFNFDYAIVAIPLVFIVSFTTSYFISYVLSKIPLLKKIV